MRSLDDQMLRHFSRARNLFSKLSNFADISESLEKQTPRHTHFRGQLMPKRFVGCGLIFPNHIASDFDLFSSNPEQLLKAFNSSKSFTTESMSRTKQEVSSQYCESLYSFPLIFIPLIDWSSLIEFAKISTAITKSIPESGHPCLTPRCNSKKGVA